MIPFEDRYIPEPNSGCWLWTMALTPTGYANMAGGLGHRESWRRHRGPIPDGICVLHKCDVRCCVNPDHLFLGTQQDNLADMRRKGRGKVPTGPRGEGHHFAILTDDTVRDMRRASRAGETIAAIAAQYGTHPATTRDAVRGSTWKHVR